MAEIRRFFVDKISNPIVIEGDEFTHAVSVLRVKVGDKIIVCDNTGIEYCSTITYITKKSLTAELKSTFYSQTEAKENVMLVCGYLKGDKTELVVQKAVELGVKRIVVFSSEFSSAFMNDNKLNRLNRVSIESAKQCGRAIAPKVEYAENLESALELAKDYNNKLFACEFANVKGENLKDLHGSTAIVVGSEGGFSKEEYKIALANGFKTVFLGKRILRAETASIALTGIIMYALGELE